MNFHSFLDLYTEQNRSRFLAGAALVVVVIAVVDWFTPPHLGIAFLYAFAMILSAAYLRPGQIVLLAVLCAVLREYFNPFTIELRSIPRFIFVTTGFSFTGLAIRELARSRQVALENLRRIEAEVQRRQEAEEQIRIVIESSPAAVVVADGGGAVLTANSAARKLFASRDEPLEGVSIWEHLPVLENVQLRAGAPEFLKVNLQARGRRKNGESFPVNLWISTYKVRSKSRLAAIILDTSEELRDWEQSGLDQLLSSSQILVGAVSHEVRNLCGAINIVYMNLRRQPGLTENEDFKALSHLIEGLHDIAAAELARPRQRLGGKIPLGEVFDDLRVVIEPLCAEGDISLIWDVPGTLPSVHADRHGLLQALLNLIQNSCRAMENGPEKSLRIVVRHDRDKASIQIRDTGKGVQYPERLFQPFQAEADVNGLGLYVSRAILRAFGGNLRYEKPERGACFVVELPSRVEDGAEVVA